jgi:hypothetical protein
MSLKLKGPQKEIRMAFSSRNKSFELKQEFLYKTKLGVPNAIVGTSGMSSV